MRDILILLRIELKRLFKSKLFYVSLFIGLALSVGGFIECAKPHLNITNGFNGGVETYPFSVFNSWMGMFMGLKPISTSYLYIFMLLAALPYCGFFCRDNKNQYILQYYSRMSKNKIISSIFKLYISVMRGTPLMLQLMVIYFGPFYILGVQISQSWKNMAVAIGFVLNYAAYFAEIYRGGIESMPQGQYEAAKILGYTKAQTFIRIILPQVIKRILPAITNETITLVKDTSLAFTIGVTEMFTMAKALASGQVSMLPYAFAALFYYILNLVVAFIMERIEKKMNYYR